MPVEVFDVRKLPKETRNRPSALYDTKEWKTVITKLENGLGVNEGLRVVLSKETMKELANAVRLYKKFLKRYLAERKLQYDVFQRGETEDGSPVIFVTNPDKRFT